jgi:hypothetical protein
MGLLQADRYYKRCQCFSTSGGVRLPPCACLTDPLLPIAGTPPSIVSTVEVQSGFPSEKKPLGR